MMMRAELQISEVNPLSMKSCDPNGLITTVHNDCGIERVKHSLDSWLSNGIED